MFRVSISEYKRQSEKWFLQSLEAKAIEHDSEMSFESIQL